MSKREKVLIVLMLAAVVYGAFELFYRPGAEAPGEVSRVEVDTARELSQEVSKSIAEAELRADESYILEVAAIRWMQDPFYQWPEHDALWEKAVPDEEKISMTYSGYLEMGKIRMAVINGVEYQTGEVTEDGRFVVVAITPGSVTLLSKKSGVEFTVPYEDRIFLD